MPTQLKRKNGLFRIVRRLAPQSTVVLVCASMLAVASFFVENAYLSMSVLVVSASIMAIALLIKVLSAWFDYRQRGHTRTIAEFVEHDASPTFLTDGSGALLMRNRAADDRLSLAECETLGQCLSDLFANPTPILFRLQNKALALGAARDDIVTRRGHVRLAVHALARDSFLWRIEDIADRAGHSSGAQSLSLPMMTVSPSGAILFMNDAMRNLAGSRVKSLDRVFANLPIRSGQMNEISTADGLRSCLVADVEGPGGRREVFLLPGTVPETQMAKEGWSFFDELPVALLRLDASGEILALNRPARDLLQRPTSTGMRVQDVFESLGRSVSGWVSDAAEGKGLGHSEFLQVSGIEEDIFVQVTLNRIKQNNQIQLVAVMNDATELKSLEKQFVQSQKMQAIGQLAGGVAHDFNNLLTAISGHCDLLLLRHDPHGQDYNDLVQIHQNANRAASLVGQLLAFSRKQNLNPEVLDLRDTLADLGHLLNRLVGETVALEQSHPAELPAICADKRQLEQVVMNLVVNARDAMPDGGRVTLSTAAETLVEPLVRGRASVPAGDYVVVKVKDEGIGISPEKQAKVFEPFFTTKRVGEGTGLGLSTAYGIIKQTGGFIFLDSALGVGTTFTLYLPILADQDAAEAPQTPVNKPVPQSFALDEKSDGVVLLVEDEAPVRAFASRALRHKGFTVLEAESAEAALNTLENTELDVDIFVTDVVMPGQDGPSWVTAALKDHPNTKVVFVSGYAKETLANRQANIPNSIFLPKPFSLNELTSVVHNALH